MDVDALLAFVFCGWIVVRGGRGVCVFGKGDPYLLVGKFLIDKVDFE